MPSWTIPLLAWAAPSPLEQFRRALADETFVGIHHLSWFDWAVLIPYFTLLVILGIYGMYRYEVIRLYYKHRKKLPKEPPARFEQLPRVTIQLPLYNERYVVARLLEEVSKIDYPRDRLQIQVLDDSTDETRVVAERLVGQYRSQGLPIEHLHRDHRLGYKAGALQEALQTTTGEFIAIFDADFLPPPDILLRMIHFFADPAVGTVQARWSYLNREYNLLTEVESMLLDGHFVLEHGARHARGLFFNFNGTAGILRRRMIEDAGGWEWDTLSEDCDLSYRAQLKGWKFVYVPSVDCPSELPVDMFDFQVQQGRWAKGLMQTAQKMLPRIFRAPIPWRTKLEAFFHLTPNLSYPLVLLLSVLLLPVMIVRFYMGWFQMLVLDLPLIVATFLSLSLFYVLAQRELYPKGWKRAVFLLPALLAAGVGLTIVNTRDVLEAFLGIRSSFTRTPKFALGKAAAPSARLGYRRRSGWLPFLEIAIGAYFLALAAYAIDSYNFFALPFLLLFVAGYWWAGFGTLHHELRDRLAASRARRRLELETAR